MIRDDGILKELIQYFRSPGDYCKTEEEFIQGLRESGVQTVTCSGTWKFMGWTDFDLIKERNNYLGHLIKDYPDAVLSAWVSLDPDWGLKGLRELERCIKDLDIYGINICSSMSNIPANDESFYPFYELCIEAYKRLFPDWEAEGFKPEVLEKVFHKNAERVLGLK